MGSAIKEAMEKLETKAKELKRYQNCQTGVESVLYNSNNQSTTSVMRVDCSADAHRDVIQGNN